MSLTTLATRRAILEILIAFSSQFRPPLRPYPEHRC